MGFEGGWLDWKSRVQGIFRSPPNHYSLHHRLDDDAGGVDKDAFWAHIKVAEISSFIFNAKKRNCW